MEGLTLKGKPKGISTFLIERHNFQFNKGQANKNLSKLKIDALRAPEKGFAAKEMAVCDGKERAIGGDYARCMQSRKKKEKALRYLEDATMNGILA